MEADEITGRSQEDIEDMVSHLIKDKKDERLEVLYHALENFDALILVRQEIYEYLRDVKGEAQ